MQENIVSFTGASSAHPYVAVPLSDLFRSGTGALHKAAETALGLPGTILSAQDYIGCLRRFYRLYRPLEAQLQAFSSWASQGFDIFAFGYAARLGSDLARLAPDSPLPTDAPRDAVPALSSFAHAVGAAYVLEGSAMGGELVLRHLLRTGLEQDAEACAFFGAGRQRAGAWRDVRAALDRYGRECPGAIPDAVSGAAATFRAVETWMRSSNWSTA